MNLKNSYSSLMHQEIIRLQSDDRLLRETGASIFKFKLIFPSVCICMVWMYRALLRLSAGDTINMYDCLFIFNYYHFEIWRERIAMSEERVS